VDKLERLLNLTIALLETARPLRAEELRQRVPGYPEGDDAFHRAFERDKDDLREMGIPIRMFEIPGADPPADGYRVRKDEYYLRDPGLEPAELAALHLAASAVRLDGVQGLEGLWKLGGAIAEAPVTTVSSIPSDDRLGPLFGALADRALVTFSYRGEPREIEPHRLDFQRGRWYLTGHDRARGDERNFRLDRIEGEVGIGPPEAFEPPDQEPGRPARPWEFGEGEPARAELLVDADLALWAATQVGDDAVTERRPDGSVVVELPVLNREAFRSFVITFLEHAEILGPADLRAEFVAWLEDVAS
jgi:predicted DNA-binding transcriptional regulator YafY